MHHMHLTSQALFDAPGPSNRSSFPVPWDIARRETSPGAAQQQQEEETP